MTRLTCSGERCGAIFDGEIDPEDGMVDCPECGHWFNPEEDAARAEERAEAEADRRARESDFPLDYHALLPGER